MSCEEDIRAARLCVVGNLNRDLRTAPLPGTARLLRDGETSAESVVETLGGGGANSAVSAAGLGADVAFVARVGDDALGRRLEATLEERGVRPYLVRSSDAPTGTSLALAYRSGERHFVSCLPSSRQLRDEDVPEAALEGQHHLLRADVWFSDDMLYGGNRRLLERARRVGIATSIDLNWDPLWGRISAGDRRRRIQAVREVLPLVDLAHGNERELCAFAHTRSLREALARITRWGAGAVVVHLGSRGAGWWQDGELLVERSVRPSRIVNSAGTGDLLSVTMMALHRSAAPIRERLRHANTVVARYMEGASFQPALVSEASA
jgi:sugar/nucleoside kinase (ribokinase family)